MKRLAIAVAVLFSLVCMMSVMAQEREASAASSGSRIYTNPYTGEINFEYYSTKDFVKSNEACQDKLVCDTNGCVVYLTGSTSISAVVFTGAGISTNKFDENTDVEFGLDSWYYSGKLGDDSKYVAGGTRAILPITYVDADGTTNVLGTLTIGFGKKNVTISVVAKASLFVAAGYVSRANSGYPVPPNFSLATSGFVRLGGYYVESFYNINLKGVNSSKTVKGKDRSTYKLYTTKDVGAGAAFSWPLW